jgi:C-terminal processing protease CtpA/Prc
MEGLMVEKVADAGVADLAGIKKGDIVIEIQGQPTRYMSLKSVEGIINSRKGDTLSLKTKRDVVIWKKFKAEG